jgi:hypothetical protein
MHSCADYTHGLIASVPVQRTVNVFCGGRLHRGGNKLKGGYINVSSINEAAFGSGCPFLTSDQKMEPQNGPLYIYGA